MNIAICPRLALPSASSWKRSTTRNVCTRRRATCHLPSSKHNWRRRMWKPLRGSFLCEFLRHEKFIDPMGERKTPGQELPTAPALIGLDEFQLAIPWRVALQQGPPPLHQPGAVCSKLGSPVE